MNKVRFQNYAKWDLCIHRKFYIYMAIVFAAALVTVAVTSFMFNWMMFNLFDKMLASSTAFITNIMYSIIGIGLTICAGCTLHPLRSKQGRIANLTLPVTALEKYTWHLLLCIGGGFLVALIGLLLADGVYALLTWIVMGSEYVHTISIYTAEMLGLTADAPMIHGFVAEVLDDPVGIQVIVSLICSCICSLLMSLGFYAFGNSLKYKFNLPITYIVGMLIETFIFIFLMIVLLVFGEAFFEWVAEIEPSAEQVFTTTAICLYVLAAFFLAASLVFFWLAYKRYAKAELVNKLNH